MSESDSRRKHWNESHRSRQCNTSKENTDCWYTFSKELEPALESTRLAIENKDVYIVSVEDVNDEQE